MSSFTIKAHLIDIHQRKTYPAQLEVADGKIAKITPITADEVTTPYYIAPGLVDAHIHIESSMLVPSEFAKIAVTHGTVATVSDPHEIANVLGMEGVRYMIDNGNTVPLKFNFGAPSCVPATSFETAGAELGPDDIRTLMAMDEVKYLAEMMNWPGVLFKDPMVMEKIAIAHEAGKPVDGHAPGLKGEQAAQYAAAGISTDHECVAADEALDKLKVGMKIQIREGSAAKNFEALIELAKEHAHQMMFCSDDKHPHELKEGHINQLIQRGLAKGVDLYDLLNMASANIVNHYKLNVGLLQEGDPADFILIDSPEQFNIQRTYIDGELVAENGQSHITADTAPIINHFDTSHKAVTDFEVDAASEHLKVVVAEDGSLLTGSETVECLIKDGKAVSNTEKDILKYTVVNRYKNATPAIAFIKNFGLKKGAIATSVAHDSHNILAVGVDDEQLCKAVNTVIDNKGGIAVVDGDQVYSIPLPVAGLMTNQPAERIAEEYNELLAKAAVLGSTLHDPFMSLSFMALLVIPALKLSDKGLFDGEKFEFTPLFV
ncbi:adenine deaminase [Algivirga pacifica]|uniref:Adenine deaminase n=1 Tax=Algivirga pacifica TaxID=1162670 RepID=A0ABP9D2A9_9BACT